MSRVRDGRARRRAERESAPVGAAPALRRLTHPFPPTPLWSDDRIAAIHEAALDVLERLGVLVLLDEARDLYRAAGASVDDEGMVRIGREIVEAALQTAPSAIPFRGATRDRDQSYEPGKLVFKAGAGCPNAFDRERGRRPGSIRDYRETLILQQEFDAIGALGPAAEPQDAPPHLRHYVLLGAQVELSDKPAFIYSRGRAQVDQSLEMLAMARGLTDDELRADAWCSTIINTNSPRQIDRPMAQGIIDFAKAGQAIIVTPFCLMGAMAPVTVAGALTLQHAEALAAITLGQLAAPGARMLYGGFASNVDLKSGAPAFGTTAHMQATLGTGQLARHIGLPWRSASGSAGAAADGQGCQENALGLWAALAAGATLVVHAAGWLEGGLAFGYEKFIQDMEAVNAVAGLCLGAGADDAAIGLDALEEVAPGGHFFAAAHTMERYQTAFAPTVNADLSNHGAWVEAGSKTAEERATEVWKRVLADFTPPPACDGMAERLAPYIEKGTKAGGAPLLD